MQENDTAVREGQDNGHPGDRTAGEWRAVLRQKALESALWKRAAGVPTYSVPEAAGLMTVSPEYMYRLIQGDGFPGIRMRADGGQGRYVVPAKAVERLLDRATDTGRCIDSSEFTAEWSAEIRGGAA
jgi:hypothetical protein